MADAEEQDKTTAKQQEDNEKTGGLAGAAGGALAGAQVGTVLLPIPVVGTFTGALVGGVIGSKVGKRVGGALLDKLDANRKGKTEAAPQAAGGEKKDVTTELERLAKLHKQGVLDDDEFKAAKAKLLNL